MNTPTSSIQEAQSLHTPEQVAKNLGITSGTLQVWRATQRYNLPYIKIGSKVMYRPEDVQNFIKNRTMTHSEEGGI